MTTEETNKRNEDKKTGVELIARERKEQLEKHGRTSDKDLEINCNYQMSFAASSLLSKSIEIQETGLDDCFRSLTPLGWDQELWQKMYDKPYKERLIIAGALIAAELDRLNSIEDNGN